MVADSPAMPRPAGATSNSTSPMSTASSSDLLTQTLRRDRLLVAAGLFGISALAWVYVIHLGKEMSPHMAMAMPLPGGNAGPALAWLIPMWMVMMVAMMIPSAAPMILLFATVAGQRKARGVATASAWVFTLGYL